MELVLVTKDNLLLAYKVQKEIFPDSPDYLFLKKAAKSDDVALNHYLAYENGRVVGITGVYHEDIDKDSIWLSWFGVLPNERSKGYGRKILKETERICKTMPFKYFRCYTSSSYNASALPLYESFYTISEKYENDDDETYDKTTIIYSYSLTNDKVPYWNNKYLGIKEYDQLCVEGEKIMAENENFC